MKILKNDLSKNINVTIETDFSPDLGKEDSLKEFEKETLRKLINPVENYETVRYIHNPYSGITENDNDLISDIWYNFVFFNPSSNDYNGGLDYSLVGITHPENSLLHKKVTNSFFRLEFFKVSDEETPERSNRKLVMSKNLPVTSSQRVLLSSTNDFIYVPLFIGTNYKNNEVSYLYWFQSDDIFSESILSGNTFYMSARFFNAGDGSIINFVNKNTIGLEIEENLDFYYKVELDNVNYTYQIYDMNNQIIGQSGNPIIFYEIPH